MKRFFTFTLVVLFAFSMSAQVNWQKNTNVTKKTDNVVGQTDKTPPQSFYQGTTKGEVVIGEGTELERYPVYPFFGYSYSQSLYLASEIGDVGESKIMKLSYYFAGATLSNSNDWTIYIGHTTKTQFDAVTDWVPVGEMTEVYSAVFTDPAAPGWIEFEIPEDVFTYNGIDNIVIAVDENADSYDGSGDKFYSTVVTNNRSLITFSDSNNPDPSAPGDATYNVAFIPNIKILFEPAITYTVTFIVDDGAAVLVPDAHLFIDDEEIVTDVNGEVEIELSADEYFFDIITTGFENYTGTVTVVDQAILVPVSLTTGTAEWPVTFFVTDENDEPLIGANVNFNSEDVLTDADGVASFMVADGIDIPYTVSMTDYDSETYTITVDGDMVEENVQLFLTAYSVTFTATDWNAAIVEGAEITVGEETILTDVSGQAVFNLVIDSYEFSVYAEGSVYTGTTTFDVVDQDVNIPIALDEVITAPFGLLVDITAADAATLTWNNDMGFFDDFESYDDFALEFAPWILLDVDASPTYGFTGVTFLNTGAPMAGIIFNPSQTEPVLDNPPYSGDKYIAIFNATSLLDDDWVIAPLTLIADGTHVTFQAKAGDADYSAEKFQVFVSTTGLNPSDFTAVSEIVTTPGTDWAEYSYDLSIYAGEEAYVAIHCTSADQFFFCIDDFNIGQAATKTVQSYNVYLDDMSTPVGTTGIGETTYDFTGLTPEMHIAGIEAIYESGNSEIVTIEIDMTEAITYTVTFSVEAGSGTIAATVDGTPIVSGDDVEETSEVIFTATPDATWEVYDWYLNAVAVGSDDLTYTIASLDAITDVKVEFSMIEGINELNPNVNIYPNPSNGKFTVSVNGIYNLQVVDITGKVISEQEITNTENINLNKAGIYMLRLTNNAETLNYKVIVK